MMAELDVAHGLTLRFRHLAGELRRASGHPNADREFERLLLRVSGALRDAFYTRQLPGLILDVCDQEKSSGLNLFWEFQMAFSVVGYWEPCEFIEPVEECDDGTLLGGHRAVFLRAGLISLAWPGVFEDVLCEDRIARDADIQKIAAAGLVDEQFAIMGYYATACDLLADWIEAHSSIDAEASVTNDCVAVPEAVAIVPDRSLDPMAAALSAIVGSEFVSVLNMAANAKATDRATAIISGRLAKDQTLYDWTADDWVNDLGMAKKTIVGCDAWKSILGWREANKVSKKTGK